MSEYVKKCCDDKQIRQELFYILRRYDYLDMFCDCLKKYNLYDDFRDYSSLYYGSVFRNWCEEHNIKIGSN